MHCRLFLHPLAQPSIMKSVFGLYDLSLIVSFWTSLGEAIWIWIKTWILNILASHFKELLVGNGMQSRTRSVTVLREKPAWLLTNTTSLQTVFGPIGPALNYDISFSKYLVALPFTGECLYSLPLCVLPSMCLHHFVPISPATTLDEMPSSAARMANGRTLTLRRVLRIVFFAFFFPWLILVWK